MDLTYDTSFYPLSDILRWIIQLLGPFYTRGSKLKEMGFLMDITGEMRLPRAFDSKFHALYTRLYCSNKFY